MLTSEGIKGIRKFVKATWAMKASPYQWNDKTNRIILKYNWTLLFWLLGVTINALNAIRSAIEFWGRLSSPENIEGKDRMNLVLHMTVCYGQLLGIFFAYNMIWKRRETANCFNQLLTLNTILTEIFKDQEPILKTLNSLRKYQAANKISNFLVPLLFNDLFLWWLMIMVDPEVLQWSLHLFTRNLEGSPYKFVCQALIALAETLAWGPMLASVWFSWFLYPTIFTLNVNYWLEFLGKMDPTLQKSYKNQRAVKAYRSLQVLMAINNDCNSSVAWPLFMYSNMSFHVLDSFSLIKYRESLGPAALILLGWTAVYFAIEYVVYPISGRLFVQSNELRRKWILQAGTRQQRRELRTLFPLEVKVGNFFVFKNMTSLLVMGLVSDILLNCLLVF